jgi:DNA modification methylase
MDRFAQQCSLRLPVVPHRQPPSTSVLHGDCVTIMHGMAAETVDFILTDPPYLVRYHDRNGRRVANDNNAAWLRPAFAEMYRLLKPGTFCVSFYGWNKADAFIAVWRAAGFRLVGHIVFRKRYASKTSFLCAQHEVAYLLAKGRPEYPPMPVPDVLDWHYTGNRYHPTEKPVSSLTPLIGTFCKPHGLVFDPFCGSGSTLVAARQLGYAGLGIELDAGHCRTALRRLDCALENGRK